MQRLQQLAITICTSLALVTACAAQNPGQSEEKRLRVRASAYNSTPAQTSGNPTETAFGDTLKPGMKAIAVSDDLLKKGLEPGTEVRIEGLDGTYTVLDRMASRHRNRIDIYMGKDVKAAREWGVREVTIRWEEG
jgi:3D (Asp-Asp-Asp) domain-containing protein